MICDFSRRFPSYQSTDNYVKSISSFDLHRSLDISYHPELSSSSCLNCSRTVVSGVRSRQRVRYFPHRIIKACTKTPPVGNTLLAHLMDLFSQSAKSVDFIVIALSRQICLCVDCRINCLFCFI